MFFHGIILRNKTYIIVKIMIQLSFMA